MRFVSFFSFCVACSLTSCITHVQNASQKNALPSPPHQELINHDTLSPIESISVQTSSIDAIVASMKKLHSLSNKSAYRPHIEELSSKLFQKLLESNDPEITMMTMLAAASCHHPLSHNIAFALIHSRYPVIQLAAIQAFASLNTTEANCKLVEALRSDYPAIRLEAAWHIAHKKIPQAFFHIDALRQKLPPDLLQYMPELYALEGSSLSMQRLKHLLLDPQEQVVIETLLAIGRNNLSSFSDTLPSFTSHSPAILEALAYALQNVPTENARARLILLAKHTSPHVSIAAAVSLIALGNSSYQNQIIDFAAQGNPFALSALGSCKGEFPNFSFSDKSLLLNRNLSYLMQRNIIAISPLKALLSLPDTYFITLSYSPGRALQYWDTIQKEKISKDFFPSYYEETLRAKEYFLSLSLELEEAQFLDVASYIFEEGLLELYPCLLHLLENKQSKDTITLLQNESQRVGAPYNRAFATLGLMKITTQFQEKELRSLLALSRDSVAQSWRAPLPWIDTSLSDEKTPLQQATTQAYLYIETVATLAQNGSPEAMQLLLDELSLTPKKYLPFVVSALLYASL